MVMAVVANATEFIMGGNDVQDRAEYPYVVSLQYKNPYAHFCGGSILNTHWVMSAAHCHQKDTISIAAGSLDKRYPTQRVDSLSFIKHPGYQGSANCLDYDYALILTRTDFDFSDPFVQSIPLPSPTMVELPSGTPMWQSGWGLFERNEIGDPAYLPDKLQYGVYFSLTTKECQRYWGNCYVNDDQRQFCAIGPEGQQDPDFKPDVDYTGCAWNNEKAAYIPGWTSLGQQVFDTLEAAQATCETLDTTDCGGVTYTETYSGWKYEIRRGPDPTNSPNPVEESWMRPSIFNPPDQCPQQRANNVLPFVGSCMGDSGGPLIMKDENGQHILVGNTSWGTGDCSDGSPAAWSNNFNPEVNSWIRYNTGLE